MQERKTEETLNRWIRSLFRYNVGKLRYRDKWESKKKHLKDILTLRSHKGVVALLKCHSVEAFRRKENFVIAERKYILEN